MNKILDIELNKIPNILNEYVAELYLNLPKEEAKERMVEYESIIHDYLIDRYTFLDKNLHNKPVARNGELPYNFEGNNCRNN